MQDVADLDTDVAQRLLERLQAWKREVGAQEPTPNEEFDIESAWDGPAKKGRK